MKEEEKKDEKKEQSENSFDLVDADELTHRNESKEKDEPVIADCVEEKEEDEAEAVAPIEEQSSESEEKTDTLSQESEKESIRPSPRVLPKTGEDDTFYGDDEEDADEKGEAQRMTTVHPSLLHQRRCSRKVFVLFNACSPLRFHTVCVVPQIESTFGPLVTFVSKASEAVNNHYAAASQAILRSLLPLPAFALPKHLSSFVDMASFIATIKIPDIASTSTYSLNELRARFGQSILGRTLERLTKRERKLHESDGEIFRKAQFSLMPSSKDTRDVPHLLFRFFFNFTLLTITKDPERYAYQVEMPEIYEKTITDCSENWRHIPGTAEEEMEVSRV
ncbi:hypothetical protein BLNAU_24272 [Blattamonas nauphoetae]|uniref:Uncharacterized protein n=1 Tax=Blattamonas nauphoetae TaxID=2049346 RepID=A0ABQ9WMZ2_9EUKA|nr:hypothetical protein BLNAU_24272 [Blattamonas nauphoetae]